MTPGQLATAFLLALAAILAASQVVASVGRRFLGWPVVGETLGSVLLGLLAPGGETTLLPAVIKPLLNATAQLGMGVSILVVGLDFHRDTSRMGERDA